MTDDQLTSLEAAHYTLFIMSYIDYINIYYKFNIFYIFHYITFFFYKNRIFNFIYKCNILKKFSNLCILAFHTLIISFFEAITFV